MKKDGLIIEYKRPIFRVNDPYRVQNLFKEVSEDRPIFTKSEPYEIAETYLDKFKKWPEYIQHEEQNTSNLLQQTIPYLIYNINIIPNVFERKVVSDILGLLRYMINPLRLDFNIYFLNELVRLRIEDTNRILQGTDMGAYIITSNMDLRVKDIYKKYCPSEHGNHSFIEVERNLSDKHQAFTEFRISNIVKDLRTCLTLLESKINKLNLNNYIRITI